MRLSFLSDNHHDGGSAGDKGGMQHQLQHCSILQGGDTLSSWQFCPAPGSWHSDTSNKHYITGGHSSLAQVICVSCCRRVSGSADQKGCKKSHYVDIYLIQFSVPYVFKRLKKQIRYSRHGEDIFQCSFMSVFFGNNVQCGVVHCAIYNVGSQP